MDILEYLNKIIGAYSNLFSFLGFVIGIFGTAIGLYNYWKKRSIVRLRESIISAHLQNIRNFRKGIKSDTDISMVKMQIGGVFFHFLEMLSVVMEPSDQELLKWLNDGYIDREDYEYLAKLRIRK